MVVWPGDHRSSTEKKESSGKGKRRAEPGHSYPVNEPGTLTSANLYRTGKRLEWSFLNHAVESKRRLVALSDLMVLPPTSPIPLRTFSIPVLQKAEQAAHFFRLQYAEVEITSELISEYITEDVRSEDLLRQYDPYTGNALALILCYGNRRTSPTLYLAFPAGETGCELHISLLPYRESEGVVFDPWTHAEHAFKSPIQQIITATVGEAFGRKISVTAFAVRTLEAVHIMKQTHPSQGGRTEHVSVILHSEVRNKRIVDLIFCHTSSDEVVALVVNECGDVFRWSARNGAKTIESITQDEPLHVAFPFFRLARSAMQDSCLLASEKALHLIDLKALSREVVFRLPPGSEVFTSLLGSAEGTPVRALTTAHILWFDERHLQRPTIAIKHGRQSDPNLHLHALSLDKVPFTFLTSRKNNLVTAYDVSHGKDKFVHVHNPPSALPAIRTLETKTRGEVIFRHPADSAGNDATMFRLSLRGSLHRMDLKLLSSDAPDNSVDIETTVEWSPEVQELSRLGSVRSDPGPLGRRNCELFNLDKAYEDILINEDAKGGDSDAVYDLIDGMTMFWQSQEMSAEHILTTFDIAFGSGEEPLDASRADFFKDSTLSSVRGHRALVQGRIPRDQLMRQAPWQHDITPVISHFVTDMSSDPAALTSTLGKYNLMSEDDRPAPSYRREAEAREQLALDLTLSATVYSAGFNDVKQKEEEDEILEVMSRATKALSLEHTEPPPVSFGFLRPLKTEEEGTFLHPDSETSICPLGVRLLLDDWKVGVDPADYIYEDPYGMVGAAPAIRPTARPRPLPETIAPVVQTLRPPITTRPPMIAASQPTRPPPTIFPSSQPQEVRRDIGWGSQPNTMDWVQHTASQEPFSRTQAMSGPHGGRPPPMKKKKRAGGF